MTARDIARQYLDALAGTLRDDPDAFGLRKAMLGAGGRLVGILDSLRSGSADWFPPAGDEEEDRLATFLGRFVENVAGTSGLIADAAIREAAVTCGEELLVDRRCLILLQGWVEVAELDACVVGGELPVDLALAGVDLVLPGSELSVQEFDVA